MYVINPLEKEELKSFFDDESMAVIKYFIIKSLFAQPEVLPGQASLPVQIPKEHIEQWFTQALNVKPVGAGSYPIDIFNAENHWGADIKMLAVKQDSEGNITNADSGEASLGQNFRGAGLKLDGLFYDKQYDEIKDLWLKLYVNKFNAVRAKYPVDKFYYFFILRSGPCFYLTGANVNLDNIDKVEVDLPRCKSGNSVYLSNMISDKLGNAKVYKAKIVGIIIAKAK